MTFDVGELQLPEYEGFTRKPRAPDCKVVDTKRIIAEILGGEHNARVEVQASEFSNTHLLAGSSKI